MRWDNLGRWGDLRIGCFSPPVMLATFFIELISALYVLWRYKFTPVVRLVVLLLIFLATFQLAEYNVCEIGWVDPLWASRIGYVAITMLPPLGIHLAYTLASAKKRPLIGLAYGSAAVFAFYFLVVTQGLTGHACLGNYVIFQVAPWASGLYSLYYYGWLIAGIWLSWSLAGKKTTASLKGLAIGYLVFLAPTTFVNLVEPSTISGIPSIMCGFAVLLALMLVLWILPKAVPRVPIR